MILDILQAPHAGLEAKAQPVQRPMLQPFAASLAGSMVDTMRKHHAQGLAAPQVGVLARIIVINPATGFPYVVLINPEIVSASERRATENEGCLSVKWGTRYLPISRPISILVRFRNRQWVEHDVPVSGRAARVIQHEIDHLDGVLITAKSLAMLRKSG